LVDQEITVGKDRLAWVLSEIKVPEEDCEIISECTGKDLVGVAYHPLFDYFQGQQISDK